MHSLPILYSFRRCPYAIRARLALAVGKIDFEHREVVLNNKPAELLRASPKATVPVLVLPTTGQVIDESENIMLWALRIRDPRGWLGAQPGELQAMRALVLRAEKEFKPHLDRYKYADRYSQCDAFAERALATVFLRHLDSRLRESYCLMGDGFRLADAAIAPFVRQFYHVDRAWFDSQPFQHLHLWIEEFLVSSLFKSVMAKHPQWQAGR